MNNSESYKDYKDKLSGIYKNTFTQIEKTMEFNLISGEEKDNALSELLDTFICAQNDNVKIEKVVGNDVNKFTKEYINTLFPFHKISAFLIRLMSFTVFLFAINLFASIIDTVTGTSTHFFTYKYDEIPILIISIVISTISELASLIEQTNFYKKTKVTHNNLKVISFLTEIVIMFILIFLFDILNIKFKINFLSSVYVCLSFLFTVFAVLIAVNILKSKPSKISDKMISSIKMDYARKKIKNDWSKEQYIANKKKYFYYIIPAIITLYIILMLAVLGIFTIKIIKYGTASLLGIILVMAVIILLSYILIYINATCKRIVGMLIRNEIKLD